MTWDRALTAHTIQLQTPIALQQYLEKEESGEVTSPKESRKTLANIQDTVSVAHQGPENQKVCQVPRAYDA